MFGQGFVEKSSSIGKGVIGHDSLNDDAMSPEEGLGSSPKGRTGGPALIGEDLGVGQAGVVVDGRVDVREANPALTFLAWTRRSAPSNLVTASLRDLAQFLHIDVNELAGPVPLVAADLPATLAIYMAEAVQIVANQHPMHRRRRHAQSATEAVGTEFLVPADPADPFLDLDRGPAR